MLAFPRVLAPLLLSILGLTATATEARASSPGTSPDGEAEDPIGTTAAQPHQAEPRREVSAPRALSQDAAVAAESSESAEPGARPHYRASDALIATDPPADWAVLHAGIRPHLGTFGGIATFALAHARTERWYGVLSLSAVRNDAGTHVGVAQVALGRNLSDTFGGGAQVSLTENRARTFVGLGQIGLVHNRAGDAITVSQLAVYNRAATFAGVAQLGIYDRTDQSFDGVAQIGVFDHARGSFHGLAQVGGVVATGAKVFGVSDRSADRHFAGLVQVGGTATVDGSFYGLAQVSGFGLVAHRNVSLVQLGLLGAGSSEFVGLAQIGVAALSAKSSIGIQTGLAAIALKEHAGLQAGGALNFAASVDGAQVGAINMADHVRGVQIGLFNQAKHLRGVQIGVANHADDGVLPWTALLNMGFGDEPDTNQDHARTGARTGTL